MIILKRPAVRRLAVGFTLVCALAVPTVAGAAPDEQKLTGYKARGLVVHTDATTVTVCVGTAKKSTNKPGAAWRGLPIVLDMSAAKLKVRDTDGDRDGDLNDVAIGDLVKLETKLPKNLSTAVSPFAAKKLTVTYKRKIKVKDGFFGGVCPEWTDDDPEDLDDDGPWEGTGG